MSNLYPGATKIGNNSYATPWRKSLGTTLNSSGAGSLQFQDPSHDYLIQQVCIQVDNGVGGAAIIEVNNAFICGTASGALDSADGDPPIVLRAGEILTVSWDNVSSGTQAHVTLIGQAVIYQ